MMLDDKSLKVLGYLKNHFAKSDKDVPYVDILQTGLSLNEIENSVQILSDGGYINVEDKYIHPSVTSLNV